MTNVLTFTALIQKEGAFTFIAIPGAPASHCERRAASAAEARGNARGLCFK